MVDKEQFYRKMIVRVLWAFGISAFLNICLVAFCLYEWQEGGMPWTLPGSLFLQERDEPPVTKNEPILEKEVEGQLLLTFDELIALLEDRAPVGDGYKRQDIALGILTSLHHFALEKALCGHLPRQRRKLLVSSKTVILYPRLTDEHYVLIIRFAKRELWPLTTQGLFLKLKEDPKSSSLQAAFMQTEEYHTLHMVLTRGTRITKEEVFELAITADWSQIAGLGTPQIDKPQIGEPQISSFERHRRAFLLGLLKQCHKKAAVTLLVSDFQYAVHTLDDTMTLQVLDGIKEQPLIAKEFALALLERPRSDEVWQTASLTLCCLSNLKAEEQTRETLLQFFGRRRFEKKPQPVPQIKKTGDVQKANSVKKKALIVYIVQTGDSLWSISKKFQVDISSIKTTNQLKSDALKPGTALRIPQN